MDQEQLGMPHTVEAALNLYVVLTTTIEDAINTCQMYTTLYAVNIKIQFLFSSAYANAIAQAPLHCLSTQLQGHSKWSSWSGFGQTTFQAGKIGNGRN